MKHNESVSYVPRLLDDWPEGLGHRRFPGTMVFVDISGFTAMSERLARHGRVGAEEVVGVLNTVFTRLLTIADGLGGDLLKFGGDALLLLFTGDNHAMRAVRAAAMMRNDLRSSGRLKTTAGNVRLRMSTGVHSGTFDAQLTGTMHRELVLIGPGVTRTVQMEHDAEAGDILLSPELAEVLPTTLVGPEKGLGRLLARSPRPQQWTAEPRTTTTAGENLPTALRSVINDPTSSAEHRRVTIAFVRLDNTDALVPDGSEGAEDPTVAGVVRVAQETAAEFEVSFMASDADINATKLILCAGAPTASFNDDERLLRAVRAIADRSPVPLRIGVHRGPVFVGDVGAPFRRTYTLIGDTVNLSARVMAHATPGQILSTARPIEKSETVFDLAHVEPFMAKGKSEPIETWSIGAVLGARVHTAGRELPLVGREEELGVLEKLVERARSGQGSAIEVTGPSGIGKSRLFDELQLRHPDVEWLSVASERYEQSTPYFTMNKLIRKLLGIPEDAKAKDAGNLLSDIIRERTPDLVPWIPLVATVIDAKVASTEEVDELDEKFREKQMIRIVNELLPRVAKRPTGVVFDETQWLDPPSSRLIAGLVPHIDKGPWFAALLRNDEERLLADADVEYMHLGPIASSAALSLAAEATAEQPMRTALLETLSERSGGNPMFLLTLIEGAGDTEEIPDTIEKLILTQLDRLDRSLSHTLRIASVIGATFETSYVSAAMDVPSGSLSKAEVWDELTDFIEPTGRGRYSFRQSLIRDVAYDSLPFKERSQIHKKIGEKLESETNPHDVAELLSLHFFRGGAYDKAWQYAVFAGDEARGKYANRLAARFYGYALDAAKRLKEVDPTDVRRVAEARADALELTGDYDSAASSLRYAAKVTSLGPADSGRIMRKQGLLRMRLGKYRDALRWFTRGLNRLDPGGTDHLPTRAQLEIAYAGVKLRQGAYRACVDWCERGLASAEACNDTREMAHAYQVLSLAYSYMGGAPRADYAARALEMFVQLGDFVGQADALNNMGVAAYFAGDWDAALQAWESGKEARERAGDAMGAAIQENNVAEILSDQGRWEEAEPLFQNVARASRASDYWLEYVAHANLGRLETRRGDTAKASRILNTALADLERVGAGGYVLETRLRMVENEVMAGHSQVALDGADDLLVKEGGKPGTETIVAALHRVRGYAYVQLGLFDEARAAFDASLATAEAASAGHERAFTLDALSRWAGAAGEPDEWNEPAAVETEKLGIERLADIPLKVRVAGSTET